MLRAIELNRRLLSRQVCLADDESFDVSPPLIPSGRAAAARLAAGRPAVTPPLPHMLHLPTARIQGELTGFLGDLATGGAAEAARKIERALASGAVDVAVLAAASIGRDQPAVRSIASSRGFNLQVLWLAADLATAPLVHRAQQRAFVDEASDALRDALDRWNDGRCPACGSWPVLAEFFYGERLNRCAFCAATWRLSTDRCTYCGEAGADFRTIVPDTRQTGRRLELCRRCGGYLKTLDVEQPTPFPLLAIEDLATSDLDQAAMHHGFRRVPMREFGP
jgi:FdhE protein